MAVKITERFSTTCSVVSSNNYDTCGTITRSSISYLTPSQLEDLFAPNGLFADLDAWFKTSLEMKACGTRTNGFYDWLMSSADNVRGKTLMNIMRLDRNPSLMFPFIMGRQNSIINTDYWYVSGGLANNGSYNVDSPDTAIGTLTAGPLTTAQKNLGAAGDRIIRVATRAGYDMDEKWFVDRDVVHIFTRTAGVSGDGAWKVLASAVSTARDYVDVLVTSQNDGSTMPYDATAGATSGGVLVRGVNNVNDYERWCNNRPNLDGKKQVPFWVQTMRRTRCIDEQYKEYYKRLNEPGVNEAFRAFGDLSIAERNAQDEAEYQKAFVNAFLFNKPISANQTLANWQSLEDITTPTGYSLDPITGGKLIAKRANFKGVKQQLFECGQYRDLANQVLNLDEFLQLNYDIKRARETQNRMVKSIDWWTDSSFAVKFNQAYFQYLARQYGDNFRTNANVVPKNGENGLGMVWDSYRFQYPAGIDINIITHPTFDDFRNENRLAGQESVGTMLLCLDIGKPGPGGGTIYWSRLAANRKVHSLGDLDKLAAIDKDWACVMESVTQEITLSSETGTVIVECPANSFWISGIADAVPGTSGKTTPYTDLYV